MYTLISSVVSSVGNVIDHVSTDFGIRVVVFDKDKGLILNGKSVKVKGLCNHQDFAGVGTAVPDRINLFRVQKLKEMGANAWRMSHNPPNSELLDYTDQNGILVWDENRNFGDSEQYYSDVAILPLRDRNHPSIVIWSLCNEGGCMEGANDTAALNIATKMKNIILAIDDTRPISGAWNSDYNDLIWGWGPKVMDVQGINYNYGEIDQYHQLYPNKPMISSETASCTGARGIYITDDQAAHKSILSANGCVVQWWTTDATRDFVAGGFSWTGFDYKGEPTPYGWPEINSNFGTIDIAGFPKDTFWYYQSWWTSQPVLHVFPPWSKMKGPAGVNTAQCNAQDVKQQFQYGGSDTVAAPIVSLDGKMCVDATCADISVGCVPLGLKLCDPNDNNQKFYHLKDGSFKNVANGGCADLWDSGVGPQVGVYLCDGGQNQHWQLNGDLIKSETSGNRCFTVGTPQSVWVYTNADSAELFINGASQGKQKVPSLGNVEWNVNYVPGSIEVRSYDPNGKQIGNVTLSTPGAATSILLDVEVGQEGINADRQDVAMLRVLVVDSNGAIVPDANPVITFSVSGPGSILGVGNGDPSSHERDKASWRSAFNGLARVIVQASNQPGVIQVSASSPGLLPGKATITTHTPNLQKLSL
uniref:Ricin B lectin domain-containing protein n=1 Tax=Arcella intermedia TaxID=1963864 RepID=A0A6B2KZM7_9EUKA